MPGAPSPESPVDESPVDEWRVDEGWWSGRPVHRRYFEVVLAGGADVVVFADRRSGEWWAQRA